MLDRRTSHDVSVLAFRRLDEITKTEIAVSKKGKNTTPAG
jgi:hypothetical protein